MSDKTQIEWTDSTWNPVRGCTKVSSGCDNCYAMSVANRFKQPGMPYEGLVSQLNGRPQWNGKIRLVPEILDQPLRWVKPRMVFVNSMSDLFHPDVPFEFIDKVFAVMSCTTRHTYQILTKRPKRMLEYFTEYLTYDNVFDDPDQISPLAVWPQWVAYREGKRGGYDNCGPIFPYKNVWLGVSVEDQKTANERIPILLKCPAKVRWVNAEPMLGPIDLSDLIEHVNPATEHHYSCLSLDGIELEDDPRCGATIGWVVTGGESGPNSRPPHPDWFRSIRDQCDVAGTAFFFKQWGEYAPNWYNDKNGHKIPGTEWMERQGKKLSGRVLDGKTWDQYPYSEV